MTPSPSHITRLGPNEVFVFGSNRAGRHGAGAAKIAMKWGAKYGSPYGRHGQTYAIATLDERFRKVPLADIAGEVAQFIAHADHNPQDVFIVTEIGCGLAGFSIAEIAPLFNWPSILSVRLPQRFIDHIHAMRP